MRDALSPLLVVCEIGNRLDELRFVARVNHVEDPVPEELVPVTWEIVGEVEVF